MKPIVALLLLCLSLPAAAQGVEPAPADKAVVYFARPSVFGAAVNFHFYDGDQLIGKFNGGKYFRYECDPGEHLFWARSENRSFIEADLQPGNIYVVEVGLLPGGLKAGVQLRPVDPQSGEIPRPIRKLITKRSPQTFSTTQLQLWADRTANKTTNGLAKYEARKQAGTPLNQLSADMMVAPEDLHWEKKRKN